MSRARHRLTRVREATHNKPGGRFVLDAFIDNDTYVNHVAGPINAGLGGGTGVTGSTSDSFKAAVEINDILNQTSEVFAKVGANCWSIDNWGVASGDPPGVYQWPYFFNPTDWEISPSVNGWIASFARRYYAYCDLNNYTTSSGLSMESGDQVNSAFLVLTLAADGVMGSEGYEYSLFSELGGQYPHDRRTDGDDGDGGPLGGGGSTTWPTYDRNEARTYNVYKVLQPFSGASMGNITWWGWTGGEGDAVATTYWTNAGGSSYGVDITELGVSAAACVPDTQWNGCGYYYNIELYTQNAQLPQAQTVPPQEAYGGRGGSAILNPSPSPHPLEVRFDITHLVQDAIDNESGILRLAVYGQNDTDLTNTQYAIQSGPLIKNPREYTYAKQTLLFYSSSFLSGSTDFRRPRLEIDFTRR